MGTGQFVVLWLAGLALALVLFGAGSSYSAGLAILILAGVAIYSLRPHPNADLRRAGILTGVWIVVVLAAIGLAVGGKTLMDSRETDSDSSKGGMYLPPEAVEVVRAVASNKEVSSGEPSGSYRLRLRVRNDSGVEVSRVVFDVTVRDTTGTLASGAFDLMPLGSQEAPSVGLDGFFDLPLAIPPGQVRDGVLRVGGAAPASAWRASYSVKEVWGLPNG